MSTFAACVRLAAALAVGIAATARPGTAVGQEVVPTSAVATPGRQAALRFVGVPNPSPNRLRVAERPTADITPPEPAASPDGFAPFGASTDATDLALLQPVGDSAPSLRRVQAPAGPAVEAIPAPLSPATATAESIPVAQLTVNVAAPAGEMPVDQLRPQRAPIVINTPGTPAVAGAPFYSTPRKSNFYHRPLYFEERATERYGHSWGPAQPIVSGARFFGTLPLLPYAYGARSQQKRIYTGDGVNLPQDRYTPREHVRGALAEAATVTGLIFVLP